MPKVNIPIAQGFYVSDALPISSQRAVNWIPNAPQTDTITNGNLFGTPGIVELTTHTGIDTTRGAHVMAGVPYFVIGLTLYRLNEESPDVFSTTALGTIEGADRVFMADNGEQLCIVAVPDDLTTGKSYILPRDTELLVEITDPNFDGPAASVVYYSSFFVFHKSDGKKFFNSNVADGLTYDAFDFNDATADPDQIRALSVYRDQLYVIGSETTQVFRATPRVPAPLQSIQGAVLDVGITSPQSVSLFAGRFAFVGAGVNESPAVWIVNGASKKKLSTTAIDNELSKLTEDEVGNIHSWVYSESGGYFFGLVLPETCFVYDVINQRWHERQSVKGTTLSQYRVSTMTSAYGRVLVGDLQDGRIGQLNEDVYTEYNTIVQRFMTTRPFDNLGNPGFVSSIEAVVENGVGLAADVSVSSGKTPGNQDILVTGGKDPQITFSWSDDGGRTFVGNLSRSMGLIGEYRERPIWRRLGRFSRSRVLKFEVTTPNKATLIKVEANFNG